MLQLTSYGEVMFDSGAGSAIVVHDSGDFTVSINAAAQLFELRFQRSLSRSIIFATSRDPYLNDNPYITVSAQLKSPDTLWIATQSQDAALFLRPRLIHHFGFWFAVSDTVPARP